MERNKGKNYIIEKFDFWRIIIYTPMKFFKPESSTEHFSDTGAASHFQSIAVHCWTKVSPISRNLDQFSLLAFSSC